MKRILSILLLAVFFTACGNSETVSKDKYDKVVEERDELKARIEGIDSGEIAQYSGVWTHGHHYININDDGSFEWISLHVADMYSGEPEDYYIEEVKYGIVRDYTLLTEKSYRYSTEGEYKYYNIDDIPDSDIKELSSRSSTIMYFRTDYNFYIYLNALNPEFDFTKQDISYEIPFDDQEPVKND